jgi:hypothetical protein
MTIKPPLAPAEVWRAKTESYGHHLTRWSQSFVSENPAALMAAAMVLPAMAPLIVAIGRHSSTLLLLGLVFLAGFGVPYYVLLRWFLEKERTDPRK